MVEDKYQVYTRNGNIFEYHSTITGGLAVDAPKRACPGLKPGDEFIVRWSINDHHRAAFVKYDLSGRLA